MLLILVLACNGPKESTPDSPTGGTDDSIDSTDSPQDSDSGTPVWEATVNLALPARYNHLLPLHTSVDAAARRAFVVAESLSSLAIIDIDTGELVDMQFIGSGMAFAHPVGDGLGGVLVWDRDMPEVVRVDAAGQLTRVATGYEALAGLVWVGEEVWIAGRLVGQAEESSTLSRWTPDMQQIGSAEVEGRLRLVVPWSADSAVLVTDTEALEVLTDGTVRARAAAPILATAAVRFGDRVALIDKSSVVLVSMAEGEEAVTLTEGTENTGVVAEGERLWVLDRLGDARGIGTVRSYDGALQQAAAPFQTGKNSGYGAYDPVTQRLWMNAEGDTEAQSYDPWAGLPDQQVRLGVHVESAAATPGLPDQVFVTGRLSGLLARVDLVTGARLDAAEPPYWPVAPVVWTSDQGQEVWVAAQIDSEVCAYSMDLVRRGCFAPGLAPDPLLVIADLAVGPGGLLYSNGQADQLLEIGGDGAVLRRWQLAEGDGPTEDMKGRLDIVVSPEGQVFVVRCADGRISRIDGETVQTAHPLAGLIEDRARMQCANWTGDRLYMEGFSIDPVTLARKAEQDQTWTYLIADGLAYYDRDRSVHIGQGAVIPVPPGYWMPQFFVMPDAPGRFGWVELQEAVIQGREVE